MTQKSLKIKTGKKETKKTKSKSRDKKPNAEKQDNIGEALESFNKRFGKGALFSFGTGSSVQDVQTVSTGSIQLDRALGIGGLPKGRIVEVYGPESGGKTTLALHVVGAAQKQGDEGLFIDAEQALDPSLPRSVGIDFDKFHVSQPGCGEEALDIAEHAVTVGQFGVVVIDSVAALTPRAEIMGEMDDHHMGLQARMMGQGLRKIVSKAKQTNTMVIFINQLRMKIGVMFGNPETTPGGQALKFFSSIRLDIRRIGSIKGKEKDSIIGNRVKVKVVKNKLAPPFKIIETDLIFGKGFCKESELAEMAIDNDIVDMSGAWITYDRPGKKSDEEVKYQGKAAFVEALQNDVTLYNDLYSEVFNEEEE